MRVCFDCIHFFNYVSRDIKLIYEENHINVYEEKHQYNQLKKIEKNVKLASILYLRSLSYYTVIYYPAFVVSRHLVSMTSLLDCKRSLMTAITENNGNATKQLFKENKNLKEDLSLSEIMREELNDLHKMKPQCHLSKSVYVPDNAWCLAALYDAREVLQSMREFGVPIWEANSHANTFLHCIIAWASIDTDEFESIFISTIMFIKTLATKDEYREVLLSENGDGLRPLELASHLGTYTLFQFLFESSELYMSKIREFSLFSVLYFDITDYIHGPRMQKSPPYTMMLLDERKMNHKSLHDVILHDPMKSWFAAINYSNRPYLIVLAFLRVIYILSFILAFLCAKDQVKIFQQSYTETKMYDNFSNTSLTMAYRESDITVLLILLIYNITYSVSVLLIVTAYVTLILWHHKTMRWKLKTASGNKRLVLYRWFYIYSNWITSIGILVLNVDVLKLQLAKQNHEIFSRDYIDMMVLIAVCVCIWDVMYYLQLVPGLNIYVVAVQRMMSDFASFGILLLLFFFSYVFGFYILSRDAHDILASMYGTFQLMLNMIGYAEATYTLQFLHVAFIFMMNFLLLNILIAIFTSSFDNVCKNKRVILMVQCLSVSLFTDPVVSKVMSRFQHYLRRKYLVYENERVYVTKVILKPKPSQIRPPITPHASWIAEARGKLFTVGQAVFSLKQIPRSGEQHELEGLAKHISEAIN